MSIKVLDQLTINKIAAGEVIERPASIVKELIENAIDAKASAITVEIKDGGISFIRITDNGAGFEKNDIPVAFLRHSTSKINAVEDLLTIKSLGFRGEALSSISAIGQVELITKTHDSLMGIRYVIEGGKEKNIEDIGCPDGTTFIVRNIFFNTPARKKFLKTPQTEGGYIADIVERIALSHPEIAFKFIVNGQNKLSTTGNGNVKDIIYHIYGRDVANNLIKIDYTGDDFKVRGFIGKPIVNRGNRNYENYFINGRYIKSNLISKAIEDGYKNFMMQHKYPFTVLHFTVNSSDIDVNVHPTKMEIRFSNGKTLYDKMYELIVDGLTHKDFIRETTLSTREIVYKPVVEKTMPEPFEKVRKENIVAKTKISETTNYNSVKNNELPKKTIETTQLSKEVDRKEVIETQLPKEVDRKEVIETQLPKVVDKKEVKETELPIVTDDNQEDDLVRHLLDKKNKIEHKIIGQLFNTYWIVEFDDKMFIIDQHAAHEKVLYERVMKKFLSKTCESQNLLPPIIVTLSINDVAVLNENMKVFNDFGYVIEEFGGRDYAISAVPMELYGLNEKDTFMGILDELALFSNRTINSITDRMATIACKAAVKGNNKLSFAEADALIDELLTLDNPYNCPHGRPTIISMSKYEIERKFNRIV